MPAPQNLIEIAEQKQVLRQRIADRRAAIITSVQACVRPLRPLDSLFLLGRQIIFFARLTAPVIGLLRRVLFNRDT